MRVSKNFDIAEFQKCGEIMVAAKRNKFAMACNFCQQTFTQLQGFMRHLQLQHNDELEFVKQAKEVEVYAVEELMNQTTASCAPDIESDESNMGGEDAKWLSAEDMKWLKQGVEPGKKLHETEVVNKSKGDTEEEDDVGLPNMSILKALKDCDVSFNLMDSPNNTECAEKEQENKIEDDNDLDNTLLRELQNEWEDSDTNDSILNSIDYTDTDIANSIKHLIDVSTDLNADVTMTEMLINSTCIDNNLDTTHDSFETSPCKGIQNLLQGLDDLDDVDSLLDNLEGNITSQKSNQKQDKIKAKLNKQILKSEIKIIKNCKLNDNQEIKSCKINKNIKENLSKAKYFTQEPKEIAESNVLNDFEKRLKQMELELDVDISSNCNIESKNSKSSKALKTSQLNTHKQNNDFASKLKYLEDSLNECTQQEEISNTKEHANRGTKIRKDSSDKFENKENFNIPIRTSFELQLKNLEESLNSAEINDNVNTEHLEDSTNTVNNSELNEDLTKALADALGEEDFDLLNINTPPEEENDEQLNQDILNLLDHELMEKENDKELPLLKEQQTANTIKEFKENKVIKSFNNQRKSLISAKNNIKSKYQKTNIKARTKLSGTNMKNVLNSPKPLTLKESNTLKAAKTIKESLIPLKGNHEIFLQQQQISVNYLLQSPAKTPAIENINGQIINNSRQKKTPNKDNQENNTPVLNKRNIKKEKLTPATNFITTERGDKTPLKREQMFLKKSPKTQEKQETLKSNIVTPKRGDKTPQERKVKQSPKTQEKLEKLNNQQTPTVTRQRTPQLTRSEVIKKSPKTQEKLNKSPQNNKTPKTPENKSLICKEHKSESPLKGDNRSNEKLKSNPIISPRQTTITNSNGLNYNQARTPLTTPQRLRNVAIKLQRFTPDNVTHKITKQEQKSLELAAPSTGNNTEQIIKQFKLPNGISLTKISKESSPQDAKISEIIETPVKPTYCQQNFSESSLESIQQEDPHNKSLIDIQTTLIQPQCETINNLKKEANSSKLRQRKASIDIVPEKIQANNHSSGNKTPRHSNLDYKSYSVNRSARKKEVLQRMRHIKKQIFKSIEGGECVTKVKRLKSPHQKKRKVLIENVQILPNLENETLTPLINPFNMFKKPFENTTARTKSTAVSPKNLADDQKQAKVTLQSSKNESSINDDEKLIKKSLKRPATSPLLDEDKQTKRQHKSPAKQPIQAVEKSSELEATQLDLSESVVDFLQRDLKANRLNVDSFLNEVMPIDDSSPAETSVESNTKDAKIEDNPKDKESSCNSNLIDDLLEQVDNEKDAKENVSDKDRTLNGLDSNLDFDDIKDINLLAKVGLKILKLPDIEDVISLEERDEMNEKANKFANMYKYWQKIWSTKYGECPSAKEELDICFKQLLTQLNLGFKLDLSLIELKRLVNLINIWYTHNFNGKLIEKRKISDSTNRYLLMFHFIPKTIKRLYYCEYCEEYFNTEHKYFTHRIVHTGALYAYTCGKCAVGFKTIKSLRTHESSCHFKNHAELKSLKKTYELSKTRAHNCSICKEILPTSELLYEHSKKHLKTIYNCVKCSLVFASAIDVHNHMVVCNTNEKRIPKQFTPRPTKPKTESYSKN